MASAYYKPCKELDICNELMKKYWESKPVSYTHLTLPTT